MWPERETGRQRQKNRVLESEIKFCFLPRPSPFCLDKPKGDLSSFSQEAVRKVGLHRGIVIADGGPERKTRGNSQPYKYM